MTAFWWQKDLGVRMESRVFFMALVACQIGNINLTHGSNLTKMRWNRWTSSGPLQAQYDEQKISWKEWVERVWKARKIQSTGLINKQLDS
ncbi:hypothetical protein HanRHA438_Chr08g0337091 [Helianthus annuus]|nr:hypothetical protein HanOQP8_Chr08g0275781 [Helianthus annuus]KAJ0896660.1 hypothetical protein HanRHA438_Chr08g0337091 [Helianthus annuus]